MTNSLRQRWPEATFERATPESLRRCKYLLVTLTWWKDVYEYVWWFNQAGLSLAAKKPFIIIGGQGAANPRPLQPWFNVAVVGDGEACIVPIIEALESGADAAGLPGVWQPDGEVVPGLAPTIPAEPYCEARKAALSRIELARGCQHRCAFCQVSWSKPYREQTLPNVIAQLDAVKSKRVSCFAPNRTGYSHLTEVMAAVQSRGLTNCGSDTRLDTVRKFPVIDLARFGVEGFSERTRKRLHKVPTNQDLIDGLLYLAREVRKPNGEKMRSAEAYMIGDLPGEGRAECDEFFDTLAAIDERLTDKFTLFLSVSSFAPSPHTPMWGCEIHPYEDRSYLPRAGVRVQDAGRRQFRKLVIACRGGVAPAPSRLCQMLLARGDERCSRVIAWLATRTDGQAAYRASGKTARMAGKKIEAALASCGFDPSTLYSSLPDDAVPPWGNIRQMVTPMRRWKT